MLSTESLYLLFRFQVHLRPRCGESATFVSNDRVHRSRMSHYPVLSNEDSNIWPTAQLREVLVTTRTFLMVVLPLFPRGAWPALYLGRVHHSWFCIVEQ